MEKSQKRLPFSDIIINKSGTEIWMDIYSKPIDSKRYVSFVYKILFGIFFILFRS